VSDYRLGLIVPSSNTTMETELPAILGAREKVIPDEQFREAGARIGSR
jgi:maleate isomerase